MFKKIVILFLVLALAGASYWFYPYFNKPDISTLAAEVGPEEYGVTDFGCTGMDKRSPVDGLYHVECVGHLSKGKGCSVAVYVVAKRAWECEE